MLKDYPIRFDGEKIFTPTSWEEDSAVVESVNETEAGTDQIIVTRYDKLSVSASFQCSSTWAGKFKAYSKQDSVAVRMYDLETHSYVEREMRLRGFKTMPAEHSERTSGTNGLWTVLMVNQAEEETLAEKRALARKVGEWADIFASAPLSQKRMILAEIIDRIEVGAGYKINIEFKLTARQFLECDDSLSFPFQISS